MDTLKSQVLARRVACDLRHRGRALWSRSHVSYITKS